MVYVVMRAREPRFDGSFRRFLRESSFSFSTFFSQKIGMLKFNCTSDRPPAGMVVPESCRRIYDEFTHNHFTSARQTHRAIFPILSHHLAFPLLRRPRFHHEGLPLSLPVGAPSGRHQWLSVHVQMEASNTCGCGSRSCRSRQIWRQEYVRV